MAATGAGQSLTLTDSNATNSSLDNQQLQEIHFGTDHAPSPPCLTIPAVHPKMGCTVCVQFWLAQHVFLSDALGMLCRPIEQMPGRSKQYTTSVHVHNVHAHVSGHSTPNLYSQ